MRRFANAAFAFWLATLLVGTAVLYRLSEPVDAQVGGQTRAGVARPMDGCARATRVTGRATITDGSSTSVVAAGGAGRIYEVYDVEVANTSAIDVTVDIRDGTGGAVLWTLMAPATTDTGGGNNRTFRIPLTLTANTAIAADPSTSATSVIVSVLGCIAQ
jgi:hypothetical protein